MGNKQTKVQPDTELPQADISIMLLGSGETGKRTIFYQVVRHLLPTSYLSHRYHSKEVIYNNIFFATYVCINRVLNEKGNIFEGIDLDSFLILCKKTIDTYNGNREMTPEVAKIILKLWEYKEMKKQYWEAFTSQSSHHLFQGFYYMFHEMRRMLDTKNYVPTDLDSLILRVKTTGIVVKYFDFMGKDIKFTLVGSQRNERRKWIHAIPNHDVVLFVASLCDFDRLCYEDLSTNRTFESMTLFGECLGHRMFAKHKFFLVFTEKDSFALKMRYKDLSEYFNDLPNYLKLPFPPSREDVDEKVNEESENVEKVKISHLPKEILIHICTFLSPFDLCQLSFVNYTFYSCSTTDYIWQRLCESRLKYSEEDVKMIHQQYEKNKVQNSRIISSPWKMYAIQRSNGWTYFESIEFMKQKYLEISKARNREILGVYVINSLDPYDIIRMMKSVIQTLNEESQKYENTKDVIL